ncbi:MAG: gliding motility protein GldM [Raineya sp.]|jgi:gliding motility-associated protein GldM|nr:gliding motility protein GldM [Raineya sp.]
MAGAKETPRQQMINLMYLVLTALLALQVSSSIIDKFFFLAEALDESASRTEKATGLAVKAFEEQAKKDGLDKEPKHLKKVKAIQDLRAKTAEAIAYLNDVEKKVVEKAGGKDPEKPNRPKNVQAETEMETLMIGTAGSKSGEGYNLQKKMNSFAADMTNIVKNVDKEFDSFKLEQLCVDFIGSTEGDKKKDYAQRSFGQTPVAATIAVLSHLKNEVRRYEAEAVKKVGVNEVPPSPDQYQGFISLESSVVATGQKIKGSMFLAATSDKIPMEASLNGSPLKKNAQGIAEIEFSAAGAGKHTINGEIRTKVKGKDTVFKFTQEYTVVQPNIVVENPNIIALYEGCGNELKVSVPELGASYNPSYSASGGSVITSGSKNDIIIIPNDGAKECVLSVSSGGSRVGERKFGVKAVPLARVAVMMGGTEVDISQGISSRLANLSIIIKPDPNFAQALPKEANYRADGVSIALKSGGRTVANVSGLGSLGSLSARAKPGDLYSIKVTDVKRTNFRGSVLPAKVANPIVNIPLN